jgi:hypothetical protein
LALTVQVPGVTALRVVEGAVVVEKVPHPRGDTLHAYDSVRPAGSVAETVRAMESPGRAVVAEATSESMTGT